MGKTNTGTMATARTTVDSTRPTATADLPQTEGIPHRTSMVQDQDREAGLRPWPGPPPQTQPEVRHLGVDTLRPDEDMVLRE